MIQWASFAVDWSAISMDRGKHVVEIKQDFHSGNQTMPTPAAGEEPMQALPISKGQIVNVLKRGKNGMLYGEYSKRRDSLRLLNRGNSMTDIQVFSGWFPENVAEFVPIFVSKGADYGNVYKGKLVR
jgi:hypothetical protein